MTPSFDSQAFPSILAAAGSPTLAPLDWVFVALYMVGIVAVGMAFGRRSQGARDYFLGNRSVRWWAAGASILATETSALTFLGIPAIAYGGDLSFIQIAVGYTIARFILALYVVPKYFTGEVYSPYQLMEGRFGKTGRRVTSVVFLFSGVLAAGVRVYITCIPLQLILGMGGNGLLVSVALFISLSLLYTYFGGIRAVIWTDVVQFAFLVGGGVFALVALTGSADGGFSGVLAEAREAGKLTWLRLGGTLSGPGNIWSGPYNLWMGALGATFLTLGTHGVDQLNAQRVLACRNVSEGRRALLMSAFLILPLFVLFLCVGLGLWVWAKGQGFEFAIPIPEIRPGVKQSDYIFPIFILTELPVAVKGLLVVAILSAAMSSVSSALSALASVATMDLLCGWRSGMSERAIFRWSRGMTLVWAGALAVVALWSRHSPSALTLALSLSGLTNGASLAAFGLALFARGPGRATSLVVAVVGSIAFMATVHFIPRLPEGVWARQVWDQWFGAALAWPWYSLLGAGVTLGLYGASGVFMRRKVAPR